ncbi:hypothetical protein [Prauserella endophytica]|uniref:hypothetical protein n=1 Tax=Prauserella endophytica TaxID=1592324 RepID=UPI002B4001DD|nr:hypothetical protein [Prauserella endophytica]
MFGDNVVAAMMDRVVHHAEVTAPARATATGSMTATSVASPQPAQQKGKRSTHRQGVRIHVPRSGQDSRAVDSSLAGLSQTSYVKVGWKPQRW